MSTMFNTIEMASSEVSLSADMLTMVETIRKRFKSELFITIDTQQALEYALTLTSKHLTGEIRLVSAMAEAAKNIAVEPQSKNNARTNDEFLHFVTNPPNETFMVNGDRWVRLPLSLTKTVDSRSIRALPFKTIKNACADPASGVRNKIQAIKEIREITALSLKDAKEYVEFMQLNDMSFRELLAYGM